MSRTRASHAGSGTTPDPLRVIEVACLAPSAHGSQPWSWRAGTEWLELYADWTRRPAQLDDGRRDAAHPPCSLEGPEQHEVPSTRNLLISCGAALHHAETAARGMGAHSDVTRHLTAQDVRPDLLATLRLSPAGETSQEARADLDALVRRRTDRRRLIRWPVPSPLLHELCTAASGRRRVVAVAVTDVVDHHRVETMAAHADRSRITSRAVSPSTRQRSEGAQVDLEPEDGLVVLCTDTDDPAAWLAAGEALSALWLHALHRGLSVVPVAAITEVAETRASLHADVLGGLAIPQLLLRISWRPISTHHLEPAPRRALLDVMRP